VRAEREDARTKSAHRNEQKQNSGQLSNQTCQLAHQRFSSRSAAAGSALLAHARS
jgi:hypothetical protein